MEKLPKEIVTTKGIVYTRILIEDPDRFTIEYKDKNNSILFSASGDTLEQAVRIATLVLSGTRYLTIK